MMVFLFSKWFILESNLCLWEWKKKSRKIKLKMDTIIINLSILGLDCIQMGLCPSLYAGLS